jgi:membrane protease subunit HflC
MNKAKAIAIPVIILIIIFITGPYFIVEEGQLAVVIRFGKIVKWETEAGLKFKVPLVDKVRKYPKKIQSWDGESQNFPTRENRYIQVDITARWQILDPSLFYESMGTISRAHMRLDDIINASARRIISLNPLREIVRTSNLIDEPVESGREKLSEKILEYANQMTPEYGIKLIDVTISRIKYSN